MYTVHFKIYFNNWNFCNDFSCPNRLISGSIIIFTSMACRIFLHRKLPLYRWFACFVITAGIVVVGVADIFPNPLDKNDSSNDSSNSLAELNYRSPMLSMGKFARYSLADLLFALSYKRLSNFKNHIP